MTPPPAGSLRWLSRIAAALLLAGCSEGSAPTDRTTFSFEQDMQGWTATAADTGESGGAHAPWSITRSADEAHEGQQSLKLAMVNHTDAAKIWIVRPFAAQAGRQYDVEVSYAFATSDFGTVNNFTLLTGSFTAAPSDGPTLLAGTTHEQTGNGAGSPVGYVWLQKSVRTIAQADVTGRLYVVVGIWGTWESQRTYYLDNISVTLTPL